MTENEELRFNAAECERMADATKDEQDKRAWAAMAEWWRRLIRSNPSHPPAE